MSSNFPSLIRLKRKNKSKSFQSVDQLIKHLEMSKPKLVDSLYSRTRQSCGPTLRTKLLTLSESILRPFDLTPASPSGLPLVSRGSDGTRKMEPVPPRESSSIWREHGGVRVKVKRERPSSMLM